jgi:hypothetical protein
LNTVSFLGFNIFILYICNFIILFSALGKAVPCVFALLPDKEKNTYVRVAEVVYQQLQLCEDDICCQMIMMDFEKGMNAAFRTTFEGIPIAGCNFHFKSALRKRLGTEGLLTLSDEDEKFHNLIKYIWALAYLPKEHVIPIWQTFIREKISEGLKDWGEDWSTEVKAYLKYIDSNWLGELNTRTKARKKPAYPMEMWNKFQATIEGQPRTNNMVEGYNRYSFLKYIFP